MIIADYGQTPEEAKEIRPEAIDVESVHSGEMAELKKMIDLQHKAKISAAAGLKERAYIDVHYVGLKDKAEELDKTEGVLSWAEKERHLQETKLKQYYGQGKQITDLLAKKAEALKELEKKRYRVRVEAVTEAERRIARAALLPQLTGTTMVVLFGGIGILAALLYMKYAK